MLRRGFLSLFSLLFARPTAALVKLSAKPHSGESIGDNSPGSSIKDEEDVPYDPELMRRWVAESPWEYWPPISELPEERPQDIPMELNGSCRQHKEGSLNA
jgi:hypothetical protein